MLRNFKKFVSFVLVFVLSVTASLPAFAEGSSKSKSSNLVTKSELSSSTNPLDSGKEILYYLFWTQDTKLKSDLANLQKSLKLSSEQMTELKAIALKQFQANKELPNRSSNSIINTKSYNTSIEESADNTNQAIKSVLKDSYSKFRNWIASWWQGESDYRTNLLLENRENSLLPNANISTHTIYATQYDPTTAGAKEVSLPDKYLKFANLGWDDTYPNPPYTVSIRSSAGSISNVRVDDVGPWNENDNYWDSTRRTWNGRLSLGTPEAYAAFKNNFNNGEDEFGRKVTNPAGIDLSPAAAKAIGLGTNESGWIVVTYSKLP